MRHETFDQTASRLIVLPRIDPMRGRSKMIVASETSVAEMVALAFPGLPESAMDRVRVSIGEHVIAREAWRHVRPKPGAAVIIRAVPGDDNLRSILSVAVLVASVAMGQFYAPAIAGAIGVPFTATAGTLSIISSVATASFAVAGTLLINALIPARRMGDQDKGTDIFAITGLRNSSNPGGVVPSVLGTHRYAPVYAAPSYTQVVGDNQFVIAAFLFGHGPLTLTNHQLGDTPFERFSDLEAEVYDGSSPVTSSSLYPQQVIEEQLSITLLSSDTPSVRLTARDVTGCEIDIAFVQGLVRFNDDGDPKVTSVQVRIRHRKLGDPDFTLVDLITISNDKQKLLRRAYRWAFPERGQYEVEVLRGTPDSTDTKIIDRSDWSAIRSFRPESPFNFDKPVAMTVLRIRASNQLNGLVDNYNAVASVYCLDWDSPTQSWITRTTNNPASLFRHVLQGPANAYPKTDDQIDLVKLQEWHEFCEDNGLTYNRVHDYDATRLDVLADIAAAGRATPHDDGVKWGVTIDQPQTTYVSAISPRNSWDFQGSTPQVLFPDGHRVQFIDETSGYNQAERIIPFPGVAAGDVEVTEDLPMPGVTDPDQIWKAARRRQYELIHRPHTYTVSQDIESLVLARGDLVPLNHDVLDRDHVAARVRAVSGQIVSLDTPVTMETGRAYACVFRTSAGESIRRTVTTVDGETSNLMLIGDLTGIEAGNHAAFGTSITGPVIDCVVKSVERGDNLTAKITLIDAAPIIDELVDAETPPAWNGRVGEVVDISAWIPAVPTFTVSDAELVFNVALSPGTGGVETGATASYVVSYRLSGGGAFTTIEVPVSSGIAVIDGFAVGDIIDVKAKAVTLYGVSSADTAVVQATLHAAEPNAPSMDNDGYTFDNLALTMDHF